MYIGPKIEAAVVERPSGVLHGAGDIRVHGPSRWAKAIVGLFATLTVVYFAYRVPLWNPAAPVLSTLLLFAEVFGTLTLALHLISTWKLVERRAPAPPQGFEADLLITTWNESAEILRHTLLAAKQVKRA